jgi:hypothetical protein
MISVLGGGALEDAATSSAAALGSSRVSYRLDVHETTLDDLNPRRKLFRSSGVVETPLQPATMASTSVLPSNDVKLTSEVCDINAIHGITADTSSTEQNSSFSRL